MIAQTLLTKRNSMPALRRAVSHEVALVAICTASMSVLAGVPRELQPLVGAMLAGDYDGVTMDDYSAVNEYVSGRSIDEVCSVFGRPHALLMRNGDFLVAYYGRSSSGESRRTLVLGPIGITYSQYDTVLGSIYRALEPMQAGVLSEELARASICASAGAEWRVKYARVKLGMSRGEVDEILGSPQAYDDLLVEARTPGPSMPQRDAFYGPKPGGHTREPLALGPVKVLFSTTDSTAVRVYYRWRIPGRGIESRPQMARAPEDQEWAVRCAEIEIGMPRGDVEQLLGKPVAKASFVGEHDNAPDKGEGNTFFYGPPMGMWDSTFPGIISIKYSGDGTVRTKDCDARTQPRVDPRTLRPMEPRGSGKL